MAADGTETLPFEIENQSYPAPVVDQIGSKYQSETADCQTCEGNVIVDDRLFPEVKNVNFFGVDRNECCDEWSGLCACKSLKYGCNCGGLKANKGHLGIPWLKSKFGAESCDYCNGGCCEKGCSGRKGSRCGCGEKSCGCNDQTTQTSVFGRPLKSNCDRCGCCEAGCPPEEGCSSCK